MNSTSLLLLIVDKQMPLDEVVFADTGSENPLTYDYVEKYVKPFLESRKIPFARVTNADRPSLEEFCHVKKITPSRRHRWCTEKWKITPIYKHVERPCTFYMGICWDEVHRMRDPHQSGVGKTLFNDYPLIDWRMSRQDCVRAIMDHAWPVPVKSGCFFCPFQSLSGWKRLYKDYPDLYERAIQVEKCDKGYPKYTLSGSRIPLERLRNRWGYGDDSLDHYFLEQEPCDSGFCMV